MTLTTTATYLPPDISFLKNLESGPSGNGVRSLQKRSNVGSNPLVVDRFSLWAPLSATPLSLYLSLSLLYLSVSLYVFIYLCVYVSVYVFE